MDFDSLLIYIDNNESVYIKLKNDSIAKINNLKNKDSDIFEILITAPGISEKRLINLPFLYKKFLNREDLLTFLKKEFKEIFISEL